MIKKMITGCMILLASAGIHAQDSDLTVTIVKKVDGQSQTEKFELKEEQSLESFLAEQGVDVVKLYDRLGTSEEMLEDLEADRKADKPDPKRPFIGLRMTQKLTNVNGNELSRVFIKEVVPGGGAYLAGLKVNDQILSFEGDMVRNITDVTEGVASREVGKVVEMRVLRNGTMLKVNMTLRTAENILGEQNGYEDSDLSNNSSSATVFVKDASEEKEVKMLQRMRFSNPPSLNKTERFKTIVVDMRKSYDEEENLDLSALAALEVNDFSMAPNPSSGTFELNFNLDSEAPTKLRIVNVNGSLVYLEDLGEFSGNYQQRIDLEGSLSAGVYVVQIVRPDSVHSEKLVVN